MAPYFFPLLILQHIIVYLPYEELEVDMSCGVELCLKPFFYCLVFYKYYKFYHLKNITE